jgi:hypothetical protein
MWLRNDKLPIAFRQCKKEKLVQKYDVTQVKRAIKIKA